jgi:hypothetical protein
VSAESRHNLIRRETSSQTPHLHMAEIGQSLAEAAAIADFCNNRFFGS